MRRSTAPIVVVDIDHVRGHGGVASLRSKADTKAEPPKAAPGSPPSATPAANLEPPRLLLSYLSIGEAEDSRPWWVACCATQRPAWLTEKTQGWPGNYLVRFWQPEWRAHAEQRLAEIVDAGFDGVYLDRVDSWEEMAGEQASARADMMALVKHLAAFAKSKRADFLVFVQNGEELLQDTAYAAAIDGIAKEDLFFGADHSGQRNPAGMIKNSQRLLDRLRRRGKPVFVVEYLPAGAVADGVRAEALAKTYAFTLADRPLAGTLPVTPAAAGVGSAGAPAPDVKAPATNQAPANQPRGPTLAPKEPALTPPPAVPKGAAAEPPQQPASPQPPQAWATAEVEAARAACTVMLKGLDIVSQEVPPMRNGGCGTPAPIRVTRIAGVEFAPGAVVNCATAAALHTWLVDVVKPAATELLGAAPTKAVTASGYQCRARVGGREQKLSEHGLANAVDISAFVAGKDTIAVKADWGRVIRLEVAAAARAAAAAKAAQAAASEQKSPSAPTKQAGVPATDSSKEATGPIVPPVVPQRLTPNTRSALGAPRQPPAPAAETKAAASVATATEPKPADLTPRQKFLHRIHEGACRVFGTVLGPEANDDHLDHLHLDMAHRRSKSYCQ